MRVRTVALAVWTGNCFRVRKAILKNSLIFAGAVHTIIVAIWTINLQNFLLAFKRPQFRPNPIFE
jgi:hypothetical protein